jgi:prepilin-type N-terminal cleavage/methylation domain-containing protein
MNTSVRASHAVRGFSMVELLVTIVIAGIVFAGMVPLFVTVLGKNADDNMRNISAILAQDKIERLRQLDYMEITQTNLNSATFKSGQFGTTVPYQTGAGTKNFTVSYEVTTFPSVADSLTEQYKEVSVDVYWTGPPVPVKHVYQVTRIYRQYAGSSVSLGIAPTPDADGAILNPDTVVLTATVPEAWRGSTNGVPLTSKVHFSITLAGVSIKSQDVLTTDTSLKTGTGGDTYQYLGSGQYQWTWAGAATANVGLYKFTAAASASDAGSEGEEVGLFASLAFNRPDPPTGLTATAGVQQVLLQWNPVSIPLGDHFEIWCSTVSGQIGSMVATAPIATTTYAHTGLTAGTTYYYSLKVVTTLPATSLPCAQKSATPTAPPPPDTKAPSVPVLTATKVAGQPTIHLSWTAAVDSAPPTPPSGLANYAVYRSSSSGGPWGTAIATPSATDTDFDDSVGYSSPLCYYKVAAYDAASPANFSTSTVKSAKTDAEPTATLTVTNTNATKYATVWVRDAAVGGNYFTTAGVPSSAVNMPGTTVAKNGGTATFTVPAGPGRSYTVYYTLNGTTYPGGAGHAATGTSPGPYTYTFH